MTFKVVGPKDPAKMQALEISRVSPWLRGQYRFWRRCGLAPWCSVRFALQHRLGLL